MKLLILKRISRRLSIKEHKSIIFGQIFVCVCVCFIFHARYYSLTQGVSSVPQNFLESQGGALCAVLSLVWLFAIPWTVAHQPPLFMGILQARLLEWVATPSSRGSSQLRDRTQVSCITGGYFTVWATRESQGLWYLFPKCPMETWASFLLYCRYIRALSSHSFTRLGFSHFKNCSHQNVI